MKISKSQTFVVGNPKPGEGGRYFVFVKLTTDDGLEGVGEVYCVPFHPTVVSRMIEDQCSRHVIGADPFKIETLWRKIYASGFTQHPDLSLGAVLSGIEMACWDIVGKAVDKPVYSLLGGRVHDRLRAYTYLYPEPGDGTDVYTDPELGAQRAADYAAQGFTAVKFDPVGPYTAFDPRQLSLEALDRAECYTRRVREAVGSSADILIGTHGQMTPSSAVRLARRLEPYDPLWFEEPTPPENPEQMAQVARATSIPIATGERLNSKYEYARVLNLEAAAILQPNLARCGGILEGKKIASMAEAYYAQLAPHLYCGPIAGAANIQLATCTPNFLVLESIKQWGGFYAELLNKPIQFDEGFVIPPEGPGLGVELNEAVALAHPYEGQALHLEMQPEPLN